MAFHFENMNLLYSVAIARQLVLCQEIFLFDDLDCADLSYTVLHIFRQVLFGAGNQGNHQNLPA